MLYENSSLARLLQPISPENFLDRCWPGAPLAVHGPIERLGEWITEGVFGDVSSLLARPKNRLRAWPHRSNGREHLTTEVSVELAEQLRATGQFTLSIDGFEHPALRRFLARLAQDLKTPFTNVQCNVYITPKGGGTFPHFDSHEVFFVQLMGTKRWRYAKFEQMVFPPGYGFLGEGLVPNDPAGEGMCPDFPKELPENMECVDLSPGSVLYLPRGYWHVPESIEDSVHFTFSLRPSTWRNLVLDQLSRKLVRDARWREPAAGLLAGSGSEAALRTREKAEALIESLVTEIRGLGAEELIAMAVSVDAEQLDRNRSYVRCEKTKLELRKEDGKTYLVADRPERELWLEMSLDCSPLYRWLLQQTEAFSLDHARVACPQSPPVAISRIFHELVAAGALKAG